MAPWLLGLLGCQVLYEPSCTTLLNLSCKDLLKLSYKAPELHGSLKLSYKAPELHGSLKLRYKAPELHGSLKLRYKVPELHGSLKLSYYMAPWLLGLLGCQVLYEPSCTTLLNLSGKALLKLSYKAPELHGSLKLSYKTPSSSSPREGAHDFNADLTENQNRLRGFPGIHVSL